MDDMAVSMHCVSLHENTSELTEETNPDVGRQKEVSESNLSYLGRYLPHLIVGHPDWTNPQYYDHLSNRADFPADGSVTRKALRQKVSKLRKKMEANGGYLLDPLNRNRKLGVYSDGVLQTASNDQEHITDCDMKVNLTAAVYLDEVCRSSSRLQRGKQPVECEQKSQWISPDDEVYMPSSLKMSLAAKREIRKCVDSPDNLDNILKTAEALGGVFAASYLCDKKKGIAVGIREVSRYLTMIRSDDGKEAARLLHCALWFDDRTGLAGVPLQVRQKLFENTKLTLNITDDDMKIWEAVTVKDKKKARNILEKLVLEDKKRVRNCTDEGKSLPYLLLADMYTDGSGGVPRNKKKAEQLYLTAAERGNSIAAFKMSCELEKKGIDRHVVEEAYLTSVMGDNADAMHALAVFQLRKRSNTFNSCKSVCHLLGSGAKLNTSVACKERYVREMIGIGEADQVMDDLWQLIVAEDANSCFLGGCQYLTKGDLKLADALFRRSVELGKLNVDEYLERVKSVRMSVEGKKYKEQIPLDYIQKCPEWVTAREDIINALANSFSEEFRERTEDCFFDDGMSDDSDLDDSSLPSDFSDQLSDEDDEDEDQEQVDEVETIRDFSKFDLASFTADMRLKMVID